MLNLIDSIHGMQKIFSLYLWRVKFLDNCNMAMKCPCCGEEMMPDKGFCILSSSSLLSSAFFFLPSELGFTISLQYKKRQDNYFPVSRNYKSLVIEQKHITTHVAKINTSFCYSFARGLGHYK